MSTCSSVILLFVYFLGSKAGSEAMQGGGFLGLYVMFEGNFNIRIISKRDKVVIFVYVCLLQQEKQGRQIQLYVTINQNSFFMNKKQHKIKQSFRCNLQQHSLLEQPIALNKLPNIETHNDYFQRKWLQLALSFLNIMISINYILLFLPFLLLCRASDQDLQTVAIIGTNDIHGQALPAQIQNKLTNETYKFGGLQFMGQMITTIREQFAGNVLYLDAGDQFKGGLESSRLISKGHIMDDFFNILKVDGTTIGNHQFDQGPKFLHKYLKKRHHLKDMLANLKISNNKQANLLQKFTQTKIYTMQSGIKIGVIGLITVQTSQRKNLKGKFPEVQFLPYYPHVVRESEKLRKEGVDAVVLLSHVGNQCDANDTFGIWEESTPQESVCLNDEMTQLINQLPQGTLDAVVQGHRHFFSHHFIRGIPVMGTINGGRFFNVMYLTFANKKIQSKVIEGPIPVCQKIFENLKRCPYVPQDQLKAAGKLVNWKFHGKTVEAHHQIDDRFNKKWLPKMKPFYIPLAANQVYLQPNDNAQAPLSNLITTLMHSAHPGSDFSLIHPSKKGKVCYPGSINYACIFRMYPSQYDLCSFEISGQKLLYLLKQLQSNKRAFYTAFGLRQTVGINDQGKKWLIDVVLANRTKIDQTTIYKGVTTSKLIKELNNDIEPGNISNVQMLGSFKTHLVAQIQKMGVITRQKLMDPANPKLIVQHFN